MLRYKLIKKSLKTIMVVVLFFSATSLGFTQTIDSVNIKEALAQELAKHEQEQNSIDTLSKKELKKIESDKKKAEKTRIREQKQQESKHKKLVKIFKKYKIDTTSIMDKKRLDSLKKNDPITFVVDSLTIQRADFNKINRDSIFRHFFTDTLEIKGGVMTNFNTGSALTNVKKLDSLITVRSLVDKKVQNVLNSGKDTMKLLPTTMISMVLPGFAQIKNKDYKKLPILYGGVGGFVTLGVLANGRAKDAKANLDLAIQNESSTSEINSLQKKYNSVKTEKLLYFGGALATYLYFLGDGIYNYQGKAASPTKAALLGLFIPGGGQIYNKSYWKLPIYYGGLAALGYVVSYNSNGYNRYDKAYRLSLDPDTSTEQEFNGIYNSSQLKTIRDDFRRARDMSIFYTCGFYLLGVIEAYVDANFKSFDVSDDLALKVRPQVSNIDNIQTGATGMFSNTSVGMSVDLMIKPKLK